MTIKFHQSPIRLYRFDWKQVNSVRFGPERASGLKLMKSKSSDNNYINYIFDIINRPILIKDIKRLT